MLIDSEKELVLKELNDDLGRGDLFLRLENDEIICTKITAKDDGIFAGEPYFRFLCEYLKIDYELFTSDAKSIKKGEIIAKLQAKKTTILLAERTLLNFIQHASGIATKVHSMKQKIADFPCALLDTRKTRPGLRVLEKYAIRCGGGQNHRMGLDDCVMLKDTHLKGVANWQEFIRQLRKKLPIFTPIEIECDTKEQFLQAIKCDINAILLDNMSPDECRSLVALRDELAPHIKLEASGNISDATIVEYAKSGVDMISSGANIYKATWLDFSLRPIDG